MKKLFYIIFISILFIGCGGGSSSSKSWNKISDLENTTFNLVFSFIDGTKINGSWVFNNEYSDSSKSTIISYIGSTSAVGCTLLNKAGYKFLCVQVFTTSSIKTGYAININNNNISGVMTLMK